MNMRVQAAGVAGMGDAFNRFRMAAVYAAWKATNSQKAAQLEAFIARLPAEARYLENALVTLRAMPAGSPARAQLSDALADAAGLLQQISDHARDAARQAKDDGHAIRIDGDQVGLGVAPLVAAVAIALGAVAIVCSYMALGFIVDRIAQYLERKAAIDDLQAAGRPDLIPGVVNQPGASEAIGKGFGMVTALAVLGVGAWLLAGRRRAG
jgi:hypothetical protein